jgi:hypothetical protein
MESKFCPFLSTVSGGNLDRFPCQGMDCAMWIPDWRACNCCGEDGSTTLCNYDHPGHDFGHCGMVSHV